MHSRVSTLLLRELAAPFAALDPPQLWQSCIRSMRGKVRTGEVLYEVREGAVRYSKIGCRRMECSKMLQRCAVVCPLLPLSALGIN